MSKAPTYSKIELLVKTTNENVIRQEFFDSAMMISGDNVIIISEKIDIATEEGQKFNVITTGQIFNLKNIKSYRTYLNNPK